MYIFIVFLSNLVYCTNIHLNLAPALSPDPKLTALLNRHEEELRVLIIAGKKALDKSFLEVRKEFNTSLLLKWDVMISRIIKFDPIESISLIQKSSKMSSPVSIENTQKNVKDRIRIAVTALTVPESPQHIDILLNRDNKNTYFLIEKHIKILIKNLHNLKDDLISEAISALISQLAPKPLIPWSIRANKVFNFPQMRGSVVHLPFGAVLKDHLSKSTLERNNSGNDKIKNIKELNIDLPFQFSQKSIKKKHKSKEAVSNDYKSKKKFKEEDSINEENQIKSENKKTDDNNGKMSVKKTTNNDDLKSEVNDNTNVIGDVKDEENEKISLKKYNKNKGESDLDSENHTKVLNKNNEYKKSSYNKKFRGKSHSEDTNFQYASDSSDTQATAFLKSSLKSYTAVPNKYHLFPEQSKLKLKRLLLKNTPLVYLLSTHKNKPIQTINVPGNRIAYISETGRMSDQENVFDELYDIKSKLKEQAESDKKVVEKFPKHKKNMKIEETRFRDNMLKRKLKTIPSNKDKNGESKDLNLKSSYCSLLQLNSSKNFLFKDNKKPVKYNRKNNYSKISDNIDLAIIHLKNSIIKYIITKNIYRFSPSSFIELNNDSIVHVHAHAPENIYDPGQLIIEHYSRCRLHIAQLYAYSDILSIEFAKQGLKLISLLIEELPKKLNKLNEL